VILGTNDFVFECNFRITDLSSINGLIGEQENGALAMQVSTSGNIQIIEPGVAVVHTSVLSVSANENVSLKYERIYSGMSILTVDGTSENVTDNQNYDGRIGLLLSRFVGSYFKGYAWDFSLSISGALNFHYTFAEYRKDALIKDISGAGNNALLTVDINTVIAENQGFGYPVNEKARLPWTYTTDGGVHVPYGLKEMLGGKADGAESWVFSSCVRGACVESPTGTYTLTVDPGEVNGVVISATVAIERAEVTCQYSLPEGVTGRIVVQGKTAPSTFYTLSDTTISGSETLVVREDVTTPGDEMRVLLYVNGENNIGSFTPSLREISSAVGTIPFTAYIPHGFPSDLVIGGDMTTPSDWIIEGGGISITGGTANWDGTQAGTSWIRQFSLGDTIGKVYVSKYDILNYSSGEAWIDVGGYTDSVHRTANGSYTDLHITNNLLSGSNLYAAGNVNFIGSIDNVQVAEAMVLLKNSDGTPYLYIDPFDHLIKGFDGTNTCVSASALVAGTEVSGWFALNEDEMWITLAGIKGLITAFAGYFDDPGLRVFGLTSSEFQLIRHLYFVNELAFDWVFQSGEQVTINGEWIFVYT